MKKTFFAMILAVLALLTLPASAQTNSGVYRITNNGFDVNVPVCWEATPGAGVDVCMVRTASGILSITQGDQVTAGSIALGSPTLSVANEGATGTTVNFLAKLTGAPSTAIKAGTGDNKSGVVRGVVVSGAGITSSAQITLVGQVLCAFDATAVTAGDFVTVSSSVAGKCHDSGATQPFDGSQILGVALATGNASTSQNIFLIPGINNSLASGVSGTGNAVLVTSATLVTPTLGAALATSINGISITTGTGTLTITGAKTVTFNSTSTFTGTDSQTYTFPTTSATLARTDVAQTFTGHNVFEGITPTGATGTGNMVFATSPTLTTPAIGVATGTSLALSGSSSLTLGTSGSLVGSVIYNNATSGTITVQPATGALGTTTLTMSPISGNLAPVLSCGNTGTGSQTCAPSAATAKAQIYNGESTLSSNAATITFPNGFTSTTTYFCVANDITTRANPVQMIPASASTATITNTTGASDVIQWVCIGT